MKQYLDLLQLVQREGFFRADRTGTGTTGVFGTQAKFDLRDGFPLVTTKKLHLKSIIHELLWFLKGDTNVRYLQENGVKIWNEWADAEGNLGRVYGAQWRDWIGPDGQHVDQIANVVKRIQEKPDDRRLIVTAWQPAEVEQMALPPCHCFFQFSTQLLTVQQRQDIIAAETEREGPPSFVTRCYALSEGELDTYKVPRRRLHLQLYQRSCDLFLGVPFNIASYALLLQMVAQVCKMQPGTFTHTYGDLHIYNNHQEQVAEQLTRIPRALPRMEINNRGQDIFGFAFDDFELVGYDPHPAIKGDVAI